MKKEKAIVFGITGNWAFALGNVLIGLKKHNPDLNADIIVYYDTLSLKNRKALRKIYPVKFKNFKFPYDSKNINNINIFSEMAFSRYECFNLLKEYKKVIWLDVDILIQKDISKLFDYNKKGIALFADGEKILAGDFNVNELKGYNLTVKEFGSGTIVLTDKLKDFDKIPRWCYKKVVEYASIVESPDQAILNLALQEFGLEPENIDRTYVFHPKDEGWENAKILHAYYGKKFWNGTYNSDWEENNKKWVKLGGTAFDPNWDYLNKPDLLRQPAKFLKDFKKRYIA